MDHAHHHGSSSRKAPLGEVFTRGVWKENPVLVHVMGLCPALAVTNSVVNGIAMGLATAFTLIGSSIIVSALRKHVPHAVRISTYVLIVATFVTVADFYMEATVPEVAKELGPFVYLIVVNCIILGRHEAFSSKNPVFRSFLDATGTSIGFLIALLLMSGLREFLGSGTLMGLRVTPAGFQPWIVMALPPGGFFAIGFILMGMNWWTKRRREHDATVRRLMNPIARERSVA